MEKQGRILPPLESESGWPLRTWCWPYFAVDNFAWGEYTLNSSSPRQGPQSKQYLAQEEKNIHLKQ